MNGASPPNKRRLSRRTRALLRRTSTTLSDRWSIGGRAKGPTRRPKAISLPTIMALAVPPDDEPNEHKHNHKDTVSNVDSVLRREPSEARSHRDGVATDGGIVGRER